MRKEASELLEIAARTLHMEGEALFNQEKRLGESFMQAISIILACKGHVAVCGMGKSGHIGRKIAATFASTGTPAFFIHPGEANHGDLGMLGDKDVLLAISNSGKTVELESVIEYAKRHGIAIIAMTHDESSPLAKQADTCLVLEYEDEACPIGCAPTTSTTLSLALGDALAMTLLAARGFTTKEFNEYHPGGALGKKLQLVYNIMHTGSEMPLVEMNSLLPDILLEMTGKGFGCAGVIDCQHNLRGIITDGDLRRHLNRGGGLDASAEVIMTADPLVIDMECSAARAMNIMHKNTITSLFIIQDGKPAGIVHMHDCLRLG